MHIPRFVVIAAALALAAACAPAIHAPGPEGGAGAEAPSAAVERFLRLMGEEEYLEMGWVFGTERGPILQRDPESTVEMWMYAISIILAHDEFAIQRENPVPGRLGSAVRVLARIVTDEGQHDVPFVVVRGPGDRWFVEQIDLEVVTARR